MSGQKWIKLAGTDYEVVAPICIEGLQIPVYITTNKTVKKQEMSNDTLAQMLCQTWFVKNVVRVEIVLDDSKPPTIRTISKK